MGAQQSCCTCDRIDGHYSRAYSVHSTSAKQSKLRLLCMNSMSLFDHLHCFEALNRAAALVMVLMAMTARAHKVHNTYARTSRETCHVWIAWVSGRPMHYAPLKKVPEKRGRKSDMRERERGQGTTGLGVREWQGHGDLNTTCVSDKVALSCVCNNPIVRVHDDKDRPARTHSSMQ